MTEIELSGGFDQCARTTSPSFMLCVSDLVAWLFGSGDHIMCKNGFRTRHMLYC
jgi:hypothetical protein